MLHSSNGAQFLNATFVFALPPVKVIFPLTKIYASEQSQRLDSNELVKNLILFKGEQLPFDSLSMMFHFFVANFEC